HPAPPRAERRRCASSAPSRSSFSSLLHRSPFLNAGQPLRSRIAAARAIRAPVALAPSDIGATPSFGFSPGNLCRLTPVRPSTYGRMETPGAATSGTRRSMIYVRDRRIRANPTSRVHSDPPQDWREPKRGPRRVPVCRCTRAPKPRPREERTGCAKSPSAPASGGDGRGGPDARWGSGGEAEPLPQGLQAGDRKLPRARAEERGLHGDKGGEEGLPEDARGGAGD